MAIGHLKIRTHKRTFRLYSPDGIYFNVRSGCTETTLFRDCKHNRMVELGTSLLSTLELTTIAAQIRLLRTAAKITDRERHRPTLKQGGRRVPGLYGEKVNAKQPFGPLLTIKVQDRLPYKAFLAPNGVVEVYEGRRAIARLIWDRETKRVVVEQGGTLSHKVSEGILTALTEYELSKLKTK